MVTLLADIGRIYVAPWGTTLPELASDVLDAAFVDLGYISEDGAHQTGNASFLAERHWNSLHRNLQYLSGREASWEFTPLNYDATIAALEHAGGTFTDLDEGRRFDPPAGDTPPVLSFVIDADDGDLRIRTVIERAVVVSSIDRTYSAQPTISTVTLAPIPVLGQPPSYELWSD